MNHKVSKMREMSRGLEAQVTLGVQGPPGASVTMVVVLDLRDPEYVELKDKLRELFGRRAEQALRSALADSEKRELSSSLTPKAQPHRRSA